MIGKFIQFIQIHYYYPPSNICSISHSGLSKTSKTPTGGGQESSVLYVVNYWHQLLRCLNNSQMFQSRCGDCLVSVMTCPCHYKYRSSNVMYHKYQFRILCWVSNVLSASGRILFRGIPSCIGVCNVLSVYLHILYWAM